MKRFNKKIMAIALICAISCTTGFVVKSGIHGAAWGMAFGGPAGIIAGTVVGL